MDDMTDTAGTMTNAAFKVIERGTKGVYSACTHAVLSGEATKRLSNSPIKQMIVTDTIAVPKEKHFENLKIISVASIFGEAIGRIHDEESISVLFNV